MRRRRESSTKITLFFATDLHGSTVCFKKFVTAATFYRADLLVLGGDFTGKALVPIVEQRDGTFRSDSYGQDQRLTREELEAHEARLTDRGFYPRRMTSEQLEHYRAHRDALQELFEDLIKRRLIEWIQLARRELADAGTVIVTAPANDDPWSIDDVIAEYGGECFLNVEGEIYEIAPGLEMLSSGYTNQTPWHTPREFPEEEIQEHLEKAIEALNNPETAIFNLHPPPYNSRLDLAPKLDENLSVETSMGTQQMVPVGSTAVRRVIEEYQPLLGLHGHVHESAGAARLGRTLCLNPGSEYAEGVLRGMLVTLGDGEILSYQATAG
jgi:Icc-related predicted phosphoesterase